jgi:hypothetical protein
MITQLACVLISTVDVSEMARFALKRSHQVIAGSRLLEPVLVPFRHDDFAILIVLHSDWELHTPERSEMFRTPAAIARGKGSSNRALSRHQLLEKAMLANRCLFQMSDDRIGHILDGQELTLD